MGGGYQQQNPTQQVFLQKVKAHVNESHFAQGIMTRAEAEGHERADELAGFGRAQQASAADEEKRAGVREKVQRRFLLTCSEILEARDARLKEMQTSDAVVAPPAPALQTHKPWTRELEAPTPHFRGVAEVRPRQEIMAEFSGGKQLAADLLDYFTCCRWEVAQEGKAKGGTWLEVAADFEVAVGTNLRPPLYRRQGQKPLMRIERT